MNIHSLMQQVDENHGHIWINDFNDDTLKYFYHKFMELESNPLIDVIPVIINSPGGEVNALLGMRDLIKSSIKPVATIAIGQAQSCGALLLASGTKGMRFVAPSVQIMVHEVSGGMMGKLQEIKVGAQVIESMNVKIMQNFAEDIGTTPEKLQKEINRRANADWHFTAAEAVKLGIADLIDIPRIHMPPSAGQALVTIRKAFPAAGKTVPQKPKKKQKLK